MNIYVAYDNHKTYLKEHLPAGFNVVDQKEDASWYVDGVLKEADVHEGLSGVIIPFTGHNGIDIDVMKKHDLTLFNTTVHSVYVAEMAHRLILASLGGLIQYHNNLTHQDWSGRTLGSEARIPWDSLINKSVGIYGYGRIGQHLETFLRPYTNKLFTIDRGKDYGDMNLVKDLDALVETSDVVVICAPLNAHTLDAFNGEVLSKMNDKTLINVGRGKIINEKALYQALTTGTLKRFASDVWYVYPDQDTPKTYPSNYPLHTLDNVIMTPHCGGHTEEAELAMQQSVLNQLKAIKQGDLSGALDIQKLK